MKAIILAGGYGTRMYPLTLRTPKPLLPVAGKPVLEHILGLLAASGVPEAVISLKESQRKIERYFGKGNRLGMHLTYAYEPDVGEQAKMGSVGALANVFKEHCEPSECLVIGADNFLFGLDLRKLQESHRHRKAHATLALFDLRAKEDVRHFGIAEVDEKGRIRQFQEKPSVEKAASKLASTAVYHLEESFVREHLPAYVKLQHAQGKKADRIGDLWTHFVSSLALHGYPFQGIWGDIGNPSSYLDTNQQAMHFLEKEGGHRIDRKAEIDSSAVITGPVIIEKGVKIGAGARVGPFVHVMHDSVVEANAAVENSIVFERVTVGKNARIMDAVLDGGCVVGAGAVITEDSVLGFKSSVGDTCAVSNSTVYPFEKIAKTVSGRQAKGDDSALMKKLERSCYWL